MKNNLLNFSHEEILREIKKLAAEERRVSVEVLRYLAEVNRRKFFLEMGYGSLFDFTMKELGYSSGAAYRRIEAMKMLSVMPSEDAQVIESKLVEGKVNLSNLAMVHNSVKEQTRNGFDIDLSVKMNWVEQTIGLSTREAERKLKDLVFEATGVRKKYSKTIIVEITEDQLTKIEEIRSQSHRFSILKDEEFFEAMLDVLHAKICKDRLLKTGEGKREKTTIGESNREESKREKNKREENKREENKREENKGEENTGEENTGEKNRGEKNKREEYKKQEFKREKIYFGAEVKERSRYVSPKLRRNVLRQSEYRCEYVDLKSKRRCENRRFLQIDHVFPFSKGGLSTRSNFQVLCSNHNRQKGDEIH